jgi:hypothetical protein
MLLRILGMGGGPLHGIGGNLNYLTHNRKQYGCSSKKLKIRLLYDSTLKNQRLLCPKESMSALALELLAYPCLS